ncbi:MAG TPA: tRNA modification GTPase [Planctomycetota bacterium]|nr:tRNA modification GTPase [Planctomycetota bacterium]
MSDSADTIVALSTPPGAGLRAVIRLSGPRAVELGGAVPGAVIFPAPRTYTREDLVEIHLPSAPPLVDRLLRSLVGRGARPARPGEFTLRAFLNGRLDLAQAEAVEQLISAEGEEDRRAALDQLGGSFSKRLKGIEGDLLDLCADAEAAIDFVDQDIEILPAADAVARAKASLAALRGLMNETAARKVSAGRPTVVLHGLPNAGKSALFNALSGADAIVSDVAGTTRDVLTADIDAGIPVRLMDAPGEAESAGLDGQAVRRSRDAIRRADLILFVVDPRKPDPSIEPKGCASLKVHSKADLGRDPAARDGLWTSAKTGEGLSELRQAIGRMLRDQDRPGARFRLSLRQGALLREAEAALLCASGAAGLGMEYVAADLRAALSALGGISGRSTDEDLLDRIFSRFCLGK